MIDTTQRIAAALLLSPALCIAQSTSVVPSSFDQVEGESFTSFPFGRPSSVRLQHYYAGSEFNGKRTLTGVSFRPDGGKSFASKGVELEIRCMTSHKRATQMSTGFSNNFGNGPNTVFQRRTLNVPLIAAQSGPAPFAIQFTFDTPYVYDPAQGGLVVEFLIHGQQRGSYDLDLGSACTSARATFGKPGCTGSNQTAPVADVPTISVLWGQSFVFRVRSTPPQAVVGLILGVRESGPWGPFTLPFDLTPLGATNCFLNTDLLFVQGAVADSQGQARFQGAIPNDPGFLGFWVRYQGFVLDPQANAFGLTTTEGAKVSVCGPLPVARLVGSTVNAFVGTLEQGYVPVTRFHWQ